MSADSHGHADVCLFECRGIVDPISGHGDCMSVGAQGLDDAQFVFWADPCVDRMETHRFYQLVVVQRFQLGARDGQRAWGDDPQFCGDGCRSDGVVARDHDDPDSGALGGRDGGLGLWPRWVEDADQTGEDQFLFEFFACGAVFGLGDPAVGEAEGAQGCARQLFDLGEQRAASLFVQREDGLAPLFVETACQQNVGGPLGDDRQGVVVVEVALHSAHQLAF
jgi:hypothetical protein